LEGLDEYKKINDLLRLEPANFKLVAQHLNHPSYRVPPNILFHSKKNSADGTNSKRTAIVKLLTIITHNDQRSNAQR
jgi:hypothetical protein